MNKAEQQMYAKHRQRLMEMMGEDSIAIVPTAPEAVRNRDVHHPFRADSDFWYLTGFPEPEAVLVLIPGREHGEFVLFCREKDPKMETWEGRRAGQEGATESYGADDSFPISDIDEILPGLLEGKHRVFYTMGINQEFDKRLMDWVNQLRKKARAGVHAPEEFITLEHHLHEMRLIKSAPEIKFMKRAAETSVKAHTRAMQVCQPGMFEYQVEAELLHEFMANGSRNAAYPSIVGGGANGCILHYTENESKLKKGDLLLIDAGAEYQGYAADITRTFPISGKFSRAQKALYQLVLDAQHAAIEAVQPGNHWNHPHEAAVRVLTQGLIELGLLEGDLEEQIEKQGYSEFYMHRTGHWLGLDVHDVGEYKLDGEWRVLEPGMVLTVEPGLYIPAGSNVDKKWWDIGIRIEDDVLVTDDGYEVLTQAVVKEADEIESLMATQWTATA